MSLQYTGGNGLVDILGAIASGAREELAGITTLRARRDSIIAASTNLDEVAYTVGQLNARIDERKNRLRDYQQDFQQQTSAPLPASSQFANEKFLRWNQLRARLCAV